MLMYNLLEHSNNYSITSGSLWNYYRNEVNDSANEIYDNDNKIDNSKTTTNKYFENKTKIIEITLNNNNIWCAEVVDQLKHFSNFWRSLDLSLFNCEIELDLK